MSPAAFPSPKTHNGNKVDVDDNGGLDTSASARRRRRRKEKQPPQPQQEQQSDPPVKPSSSSSSPRRPHHYDTTATSTIAHSPSSPRKKKGGRHANNKRIKKRTIIAFITAAFVGAFSLLFLQRKYPEFFLRDMQSYFGEFNVSAIFPPIPLNLSAAITDANVTFLNDFYDAISSAMSPETYPGREAKALGYQAKYPIVLIPGFVTTGLEVWEGEPCASSLFRQRLWGSYAMLQTMLIKGPCWTKHMALDMKTGLDPPGIRIRPAQGLEAADFFMPGFWVWAKFIRDFAAIGYDHHNLVLMSYDWRLSLHDLERRDHYFTSLKARIELVKKINNEKVVMLAHSYGSNVMLYFFQWVSQSDQGGPKWIEEHINTFVNIAGPLLGVIKAATSYLSGEMHDTAELPRGIESTIFGSENHAFHRTNRKKLFRTWGSLTAMLPKGGEALWGDFNGAPEDQLYPPEVQDQQDNPTIEGESGDADKTKEGGEEEEEECLPRLSNDTDTFEAPSAAPMRSDVMSAEEEEEAKDHEGGSDEKEKKCVKPSKLHPIPMKHGQAVGFTGEGAALRQNWTIQHLMDHLANDPEDPDLSRRMTEDYDFGYQVKFDRATKKNKKYWTNPLSLQLPQAPSMRILCYYGVGKPTERAYLYKTDADGQVDAIDVSVDDPARNISAGVLMGEGDGTVTLMSLGFACNKLWKLKSHNPAGVSVTTRELWHTKEGLLTFRGAKESDHVNIMGNTEMAAEILKLVSGNGEEDVIGQNRHFSSILDMVEKVQLK